MTIWKDVRKNIKYITTAAFADIPDRMTQAREDYIPTFTLSDEDHDGLLSFSKLFYKHYKDPTENSFVQEAFDGDWKHWDLFKNCPGINRYYVNWRRQADMMLYSDAMNQLIATAFDSSNKNSFQALKYLVEKGTPAAPKKSVGRPKKDKEEAEVDTSDLLADIARIKDGK